MYSWRLLGYVMCICAVNVVAEDFTIFCPPEWKSFNGFCYKRIEQMVRIRDDSGGPGSTNAGARRQCLYVGGDLASIHSQEEMQFVIQNFNIPEEKAGEAQWPWIGLYREHNTMSNNVAARRQNWLWTDNTPYEYKMWHGSEPNSGERYARLSALGYAAVSSDSNQNLKPLCKRAPLFGVDTLCHGSDCFTFHPEGATWQQARETCRAEGRDVLVDETKVLEALGKILEEHQNQVVSFWLYDRSDIYPEMPSSDCYVLSTSPKQSAAPAKRPCGETNPYLCHSVSSCPCGWNQYGDKCYLFDTEVRRNYQDTLTFCQMQGSMLAELESVDSNSFVGQIAPSPWFYFLNLRRGKTGWLWQTSKNPISYNGLRDLEEDTGHMCMGRVQDGWATRDCNGAVAISLCQLGIDISNRPSIGTTCSSSGQCYFMVPRYETLTGAKTMCNKYGAILAQVSTDQVTGGIAVLLSHVGCGKFWVDYSEAGVALCLSAKAEKIIDHDYQEHYFICQEVASKTPAPDVQPGGDNSASNNDGSSQNSDQNNSHGMDDQVDNTNSTGTFPAGEQNTGEGVNNNSPTKDNSHTGAIIGAVLGVILVLLVVLIGIIYLRRRKRRKVPDGERPPPDGQSADLVQPLNTLNRAEKMAPPRPAPPLFKRTVKDTPDIEDDMNSTTELDEEDGEPIIYENVVKKLEKPDNTKILLADLAKYMAEMRKDDGFNQQFKIIDRTLDAGIAEDGHKKENYNKNRFKNIITYDHKRVRLKIINGDLHSDYINATYIDGYKKKKEFIASQGPNRHSVLDMWRMIWEQDVKLVVMITKLVENGKKKCEQYWPDIKKSVVFGQITVTTLNEEKLPDYTIREFLMKSDGMSRQVRQFQFTNWPDHGVPSHAGAMLKFHRRIQQERKDNGNIPIIHCSAGVGRTGTFIAIDVLLQEAEETRSIDVFNCVWRMRHDRMNMVQTVKQYSFIHQAILEAYMVGDTSLACAQFSHQYNDMKKEGIYNVSKIEAQFKLLENLKQEDLDNCDYEINAHDAVKVRDHKVVPVNKIDRVILTTKMKDRNEFINAVFVPGYRKKTAILATQAPLSDTVVDLWRMAWDYKTPCIVMLNTAGEAKVDYISDGTEMIQNVGPFVISVAHKSRENGIHVRDIILKKGKQEVRMRHFAVSTILSSMPKEQCLATLQNMHSLVTRWQQQTGDKPIIVHCINGCQWTGIYSGLSYLIGMANTEQEVDVFQVVQQIRKPRPQFITDLDQYSLLFEGVENYLQSFGTYSNFT